VHSHPSTGSVGVVVIGRNEGERLARCLESIPRSTAATVYVDSGSTDDSVQTARRARAEIVELDTRLPFTAARARNEGFRRLKERAPHVSYVQFVDGDCELAPPWLDKALEFLESRRDVALVCGRRRERHPERSIYNLLCDIEWDTPIGEALACGGDSLMRVEPFEAVEGFRTGLIAGEEPELCVRLRAAGWRIWRLDAEMTLHDASITRFAQWWNRSKRAGYAFAAGASLHASRPEHHGVRESRRAWFWALGVPVLACGCTALLGPPGLLMLGLYPIQVIWLALRGHRSRRENWCRAVFLVMGKFPEFVGQLKFRIHRSLGATPRLIEYK